MAARRGIGVMISSNLTPTRVLLTHASLFTGKGGFDLGARWAGIPTLWQCEIDRFCQAELRKRYPEATLYPDITTLDLKALQHVDIISGGFPCQPFSTAGQRRGAEDHRYLWPAMRGVIESVRPSWVVVENVAGIATMELPVRLAEVDGETVLLRVIRDLIRLGYRLPVEHDGTPIVCNIPACAVGAPHRRDRIWITATLEDTDGEPFRGSGAPRGQQQLGHTRAAGPVRAAADPQRSGRLGRPPAQGGVNQPNGAETQWRQGSSEHSGSLEPTPYPSGPGWDQEPQILRGGQSLATPHDRNAPHPDGKWEQQPSGTQREVGRWAPDSNPWAELWPEVAARLCQVDAWLSGRLRRSRGPSSRNQQLKHYGNSIVPQLAWEIFEGIKATYRNP